MKIGMAQLQKLCWFQVIIVSYILCGTILLPNVHASKLKVINENENEIMIKIIPEPALVERAKYSKIIKGVAKPHQKNFTTFEIMPKDIEGKSHFAVAGITDFFLGDTCRNLSVLKNYEITFQNNILGMTCIAEEIPESPLK